MDDDDAAPITRGDDIYTAIIAPSRDIAFEYNPRWVRVVILDNGCNNAFTTVNDILVDIDKDDEEARFFFLRRL